MMATYIITVTLKYNILNILCMSAEQTPAKRIKIKRIFMSRYEENYYHLDMHIYEIYLFRNSSRIKTHNTFLLHGSYNS